MKTALLAMLTLIGLLMGCSSEDPEPVSRIWSQGCSELVPDKDIYRLNLSCCAHLEFPYLDLTRGQSFSVPATLYNFTGGGYNSQQIMLKGQVSRDGGTLTLTYEPGYAVLSVFKPGHALLACDCFCR